MAGKGLIELDPILTDGEVVLIPFNGFALEKKKDSPKMLFAFFNIEKKSCIPWIKLDTFFDGSEGESTKLISGKENLYLRIKN